MTSNSTAPAIIVVNYGSHALIEKNLAEFDHDPDRIVILVDNYSGDAERQAITALAADRGWQLVTSPENGGFGRGCNLGARRASELGCDAVLFLNPDASLEPSAVDQLIAHVRADGNAFAAPRIVDSSGAVVFAGAELDRRTGATAGPGRSPKGHPVEPWLTGACLATSVTLFDRLGGFDEDYFLYWEDVELSMRAAAAGARLDLLGQLVATHDEGLTHNAANSRAKSDTYYYYNCRNRLLFAAGHLRGRELAGWVLRTPAQSWAILMRGGRRQLLDSRSGLWAAISGSMSGLRAVLSAVRRRGRS